jgi:hypothetical protein
VMIAPQRCGAEVGLVSLSDRLAHS